MWTPELHRHLPRKFKEAAQVLLLCLQRAACDSEGQPLNLPADVVALMLQKAAFPVRAWASQPWLDAQRVRQPEHRAIHVQAVMAQGAGEQPGAAAAAGAEGGQAAANPAQAAQGAGGVNAEGGALPIGGQQQGPPAGLAAMMHHIVVAVQEQLAGGPAQVGGVIPLPADFMADAAPGLFWPGLPAGAGGGQEGEGDEVEEDGGLASDEEGDGPPPHAHGIGLHDEGEGLHAHGHGGMHIVQVRRLGPACWLHGLP